MKSTKEEIEKALFQGKAVQITKDELSRQVEHLVKRDSMRYIEAVVYIAEDLDIEPTDISKIISAPLLNKITAEAQSLNNIPRSNTATLF